MERIIALIITRNFASFKDSDSSSGFLFLQLFAFTEKNLT